MQISLLRQHTPASTGQVDQTMIKARRTFTGTLEVQPEFVVTPKICDRTVNIGLDLAGAVKRG